MTETSTLPYAAIIFDMDGLLVDSETVWFRAEDDLIRARGHVYTEEVRANVIGHRMDSFMRYMKDHYGFSESVEELIEELITRMLAIIPELVKPQPGAAEMVAWAQASGLPYAVASSSPMRIIDAILDSQGWGEALATRFSADDDAHGKPAPDVYLRAARHLGVEPARCLALEDSPTGARAAVAAGMTCFAVPDTSHTQPAAFAGITPHVFSDLHAALAHLHAG